MHKPIDGIGEYGELVPGPPWILGHRGAPVDAPENTLVSLRRALDLGLDGVEYDVHACATGEPVLIHDETLERTTDGHGLVRDLTLPELTGLDAGGWFKKVFVGEPLPLLEEALDLPGNRSGAFPQHMIELKDPTLAQEVARQLRERAVPLSVRVASFHRRVCLEARDLGLPTMLLAYEANKDDLAFVRDERLSAFGTAPGGWTNAVGALEWDCERWSWAVDDPDDLYAACRTPLFGFNTNYPRRALATRALVYLTPDDDGPYPLRASPLEVPVLDDPRESPLERDGKHGEWTGEWHVDVRVRNPFGFPVAVALGVAVRGGAFEVSGAPVALRLDPQQEASVPLTLAGGSWSPAEDPSLHARFVWRRGPGRPEESLVLERPLERVRTLTLGATALRVPMLREHPTQVAASMTLRRQGRDLIAWVENPGGLADVRAVLRIGDRVRVGGRGVRVPLPTDSKASGALRFSIGFEGRAEEHAPRELRRFGGGLPYGLRAGAPGRLLLDADA